MNSNNIFESQVLLETIISDLERIEQKQEKMDQRQDSIQRALARLRADLVKSGMLKVK